MDQTLRESLVALPCEPGVYLMKDVRGAIIYVGKAKSLKPRVNSYFMQKNQTSKTAALVAEIRDFSVILVQTEVEALLLERTLIKHHQPRYNILLRDDKEYPFLRVDFKAAWPRIEKVRRRKDDGATYLGPYGNPGFLRLLLDAAHRIFPLIRCSSHEFASAKRPCNYYHMKLCLAPCTLPVERDVYLSMIENALAFLQGKGRDVAQSLKAKMLSAADREDYEAATVYRDQLIAFESVSEKQAVMNIGVDNADFIGYAANDRYVSFQVMMVRDSRLIGTDAFLVEAGAHDAISAGIALTEFLLQYYDGRTPPTSIYLPVTLEDSEDAGNLASALTFEKHDPEGGIDRPDKPRKRIAILVPQRGPKRDLIETALKNAGFALAEADRRSERKRVELEILQEKLRLPVFPRRIECIDISNIQGTAIVASNVCFIDGKPSKEHYRHYSLTDESTTGPDDFGSIKAVVLRRLARAQRDGDAPDLLIIDGGKGQLNAALEAAREHGGSAPMIVGLAKSRVEKDRFTGRIIDTSAPKRSFERVFVPEGDDPIPLTPGSSEYRLMTHIRDEAHRFAITHHRKKRSKILQGSTLEKIPGIGKTLRQRLIRDFGGMDGLRRASLEELRAVKGLREEAAVALFSHLQSET